MGLGSRAAAPTLVAAGPQEAAAWLGSCRETGSVTNLIHAGYFNNFQHVAASAMLSVSGVGPDTEEQGDAGVYCVHSCAHTKHL